MEFSFKLIYKDSCAQKVMRLLKESSDIFEVKEAPAENGFLAVCCRSKSLASGLQIANETGAVIEISAENEIES